MPYAAQSRSLQNQAMSANGHRRCPRCGDLLHPDRDGYLSCLSCGFVDYSVSYAPVQTVSAFVRDQYVRYRGVHSSMQERLVKVRMPRRGHGIPGLFPVIVFCPFCDVQMEKVSLSGMRKEKETSSFRCPNGHGIRLTNDGTKMAWR